MIYEVNELKKPAQLRKLHKKNHNKKPKTLRQNVLHPLLITISAISVITLLFFNVFILLILYTGMHNDVHSITSVIEQIAKVEGDTADEPEQIFELFKQEIEARSVSYRANMVVFDEKGDVTRTAYDIYSDEEAFVEEKVKECIDTVPQSGEIVRIRTSDDILLFSVIPLSSETNARVAVYTSVRSLLSAVKSGNKAFLIIIALSVLGFIIASNIISDHISKPIKALSDHMDVIGDGDFTPVHVEGSSAEIEKLTVSINEMLARLEAYNKAHTTSLQNLSHDLRTPLMSISGYAEAIKYGFMDNEEAADVIIKESKRLTEVVEKLLILSQLDTLNQPVNMVPIYLSDFMEEEVTRLEGYAMQNSVQLQYHFERQDIKVLADYNLLSTVIQNLISNAVRYAKSQVDIYIYDIEAETRLCVADDGNGLSEEDKKYLFTRYYVGQTGHSGLGLSTSKSAADYMGCELRGENRFELNENDTARNSCGAVFTLSFPKYE